MKDAHGIRRSAKARMKQLREHASAIEAITDCDYDTLTDEEIAILRERSEAVVQCVHELNAYRNVLLT